MVYDKFPQFGGSLWLNSDIQDDESGMNSLRTTEIMQYPNIDILQGLATEGDSPQEEGRSSAGFQRSTVTSGVKAEKEKKKRTRVTPEQLVHLERYFAMDRNPTAARRKDISDLLGMQERQTQIWFQNRRAKAKLQDGKNTQFVDPVLDASPLSAAFAADLHNIIHEEGPVSVIPCTDLSIGTWRRISSSATGYDLVAYVSEPKRCLTWFIHSAGYGFKMELPFHTIVDTEFKQVSSGAALAVLLLSQPPLFYMEKVAPNEDGFLSCSWKRCSDWTEDHQASKVFRHSVVGSAAHLNHLLRILRLSPMSSLSPSPTTFQAEVPPSLSGYQSPMYYQQSPVVAGPPTPYRTEGDLRSQPQSATSTSFPSPTNVPMQHSMASVPTFQQNYYHQRQSSQPPSIIPSSSAPVDLQSAPHSPIPYPDGHQGMLVGSGVPQHLPYASSSQAILTRPYDPQVPHRFSNSSSQLMTGISSPIYDL